MMAERDQQNNQQPLLSTVTGMVQYSDRHNEFMTSVFPPKDITNSLGEVVSKAGLVQLRAAETEKYPHVTFFFNGGREQPFPGEERILVRTVHRRTDRCCWHRAVGIVLLTSCC